jgi:hypothetical protein
MLFTPKISARQKKKKNYRFWLNGQSEGTELNSWVPCGAKLKCFECLGTAQQGKPHMQKDAPHRTIVSSPLQHPL